MVSPALTSSCVSFFLSFFVSPPLTPFFSSSSAPLCFSFFFFSFLAFPPSCFVHAVHCAQTRALLRNAGLASASTNKRTGAVPAGGYRTSTPPPPPPDPLHSATLLISAPIRPSVHHFPLMESQLFKHFLKGRAALEVVMILIGSSSQDGVILVSSCLFCFSLLQKRFPAR